MRRKKHPVKLSEKERTQLKGIIKRGKHPATLIKRANILLGLDETQGKAPYQKELAK